MTADTQQPARPVHLVGSVPLASADDVFRASGEALGPRLKRYPDGETGRRRNWINFQYSVFARNPMFEFAGPPVDLDAIEQERNGEGADYAFTRVKLRDGVDPSQLVLTGLNYAAHALESYKKFAALKESGAIHAGARFQLSLPTPLAPVAMFVAPANLFAVLPKYAQALGAELARVLEAVPHDQLAVQWDVAVEFGLWEGLFPPPPGDWKPMLLGQLASLSGYVPADVHLGYHLCYGDRGHKHFIEPKDTANLVEVANGIMAGAKRPLNWLHLPVPRDRSDDAYFEPLRGLKLAPETELYLGLVHFTDGVEGTRKRVAAAERVVKNFGVGTECGLGRRDPKTIPELLRIHAAVSDDAARTTHTASQERHSVDKNAQLATDWFYKENWNFKSSPAGADIVAYGKALLICANGDGKITEAERAWVLGYSAAKGQSAETIETLRAYEGKDDIAAVIAESPAVGKSKRALVFDACRAASADGDLHADEWAMIVKMAGVLDVSPDDAAAIRKAFEDERAARDRRVAACFPQGTPF